MKLREEEIWRSASNFGCFSLSSLFNIEVDMLISKLKFKGKFSGGNNFENSNGYQMFT